MTPEVQTGRDCDFVSSISSLLLNVLTSKGSPFGRIDQILYNINSYLFTALSFKKPWLFF